MKQKRSEREHELTCKLQRTDSESSSSASGSLPLGSHFSDDCASPCSSQPEEEAPCASVSVIGGRPYMEDCHLVARLPAWPPHASTSSRAAAATQGLYACFDGHGGSAVAEFLADNAQAYIERALSGRMASSSGRGGGDGASASASAPDAVAAALSEAFVALDRDLPTRAKVDEIGGSTAVCVVASDEWIVCANCGDSRAVLARGDDEVIALSDDHKPEREDEEARVRRCGGRIIHNGGARVMGMLSMTRAIGDTALQRFGITPVPEIKTVARSPDDQFLILASDGLWGALSSADAVSIARRCIQRCARSPNVGGAAGAGGRAAAARVAAKVLVEAALRLGSRDNITCIVVDLRPAGVEEREASPEQVAEPLAAPLPATALWLRSPLLRQLAAMHHEQQRQAQQQEGGAGKEREQQPQQAQQQQEGWPKAQQQWQQQQVQQLPTSLLQRLQLQGQQQQQHAASPRVRSYATSPVYNQGATQQQQQQQQQQQHMLLSAENLLVVV